MTRLIDADALKEIWTIASPEPYSTDATEVLYSIGAQPTAYDVDKVVEQLDRESGELFGKIKVITLDLAIEIVRKGGVSDGKSD